MTPIELAKGERFYRPELDTLRFAAFLAVFVHHVFPNEPGWWTAKTGSAGPFIASIIRSGAYGVDLFFMLSAYLITELLLREHDATGQIRVAFFLGRRALRIWPLYFAFLIFSFFADPWVDHRGLTLVEASSFFFFVGNWQAAFHGHPESIAAPLWSVSIEEQFYVTWPLILSRLKTTRLVYFTAGLVLFSTVSRLVFYSRGWPHPAIWSSTITRLDAIAAGIWVAAQFHGRKLPHLPFVPTVIAALLLAISVEALWPLREQSIGASLFNYPVVAFSSVLLLLTFSATDPATWFGRLLRARLFVLGGKISYGLYVFHMFGIAVANSAARRFFPTGAGLLYSVTALALTVIAAIISYRVLELPFLRLKRRLTVVPSGAT